MVLGRFVDAGVDSLLAALSGGRVFVTPTILDPREAPPFRQQPRAEFAKGIFAAQRDLARPFHDTRVRRRTAFYGASGSIWQPVTLSPTELALAAHFAAPATLRQARTIQPAIRAKRIDAGEAECAAVAVTRGWVLWTDDAAIIDALAVLHPGHPVERISHLLVRAVRQGLIACQDAADLYNVEFVGQLGLYSRVTLHCHGERIVVR